MNAELDRALGTEQMAAVIEKVNEIEELQGELSVTAESAGLPGEPMSERDVRAVLRALREMREERNRLEGELDTLIEGLGK